MLSEQMFEDISVAFERLRSDPSARAAVLISAKPDCFVAGADINMLAAQKTTEAVRKLSA